jgi:hypothetical protein
MWGKYLNRSTIYRKLIINFEVKPRTLNQYYIMKYILFVLLLMPSFLLAQSSGKDKKADAKSEGKATKETVKIESKTSKEATKTEAKVSKEDTKTDVKATKEAPKAETKPTKSIGITGAWVCGSSDVWHSNKDCSALKNCKQTVTEGKGKASRQCKICEKSNK